MLKTLFATKVGMTTKYTADGKRVGATVLAVSPVKIAGMRTPDKHGYSALILKSAPKNAKVHKEVRIQQADLETFKVDEDLNWIEAFAPGDKVNVVGVSKGHGFTGVVKRYHFKGGPRTHGQSDRERSRGSSGQTTTPGKVYKGKRMAGRMGNDQVTLRNLVLLEIHPETSQIVLIGAVPGPTNAMVQVTKE